MSMIVKALQAWVPDWLKRRQLGELCALTASAFQVQAPDLSELSFDEALLRYAEFSKEQAEKAVREGRDLRAIQDRLYEGAFRMGNDLRKALHIADAEQAASAFELLYRMIGIQASCRFPGEVTVSKCYFSRFYSGEVCEVMSALDSGVAAGLCGGGSLDFDRRITEGSECCRARFVWGGLPKEGRK